MTLKEFFFFWERVRNRLLKGVENLTPEQLDWKPSGAIYSIADLLRHIADAESFWIEKVILNRDCREVTKEAFPNLQAILKELERAHQETINFLSEHTLEDWGKKYKIENHELSLEWILFHVFEHEIHHRAQIILMLRMQGIEPPQI
jgi:uncharacterized damage-inducible protein DinB